MPRGRKRKETIKEIEEEPKEETEEGNLEEESSEGTTEEEKDEGY